MPPFQRLTRNCPLPLAPLTWKVIRLAGSAAPPTSNLVSHHLQQCSKVLPQQGMRPYGPLTILGAYGSHLWVVNAWGRPEIVDLSHPSIRCGSWPVFIRACCAGNGVAIQRCRTLLPSAPLSPSVCGASATLHCSREVELQDGM